MFEIFKTVFVLSILGSVLTVVLLCLKPLISKKISPKGQYFIWLFVALSMMLPVYHWIHIPVKIHEPSDFTAHKTNDIPVVVEEDDSNTTAPQTTMPDVPSISSHQFDGKYVVSYFWFSGMMVFIVVVFGSYILYCRSKRKHPETQLYADILQEVKELLHIRKNLKVRISSEASSPLLVGLFFPTVILPDGQFSEENIRMIFLHELTHYKHGDLWVKWIIIFINSVHWFNPMAYVLRVNISEALESFCDISVTAHMSAEEKKLYMQTILSFVKHGGRKNV